MPAQETKRTPKKGTSATTESEPIDESPRPDAQEAPGSETLTETLTELLAGTLTAAEAVEAEERVEEEALGENDGQEEEGEEQEEEEAPLDRILALRTATWRSEEPEESPEPGVCHQLDLEAEPGVIFSRQADEFVCSGCFLMKRLELLADPQRRLCRDCAA
jgi:hypothetical protein